MGIAVARRFAREGFQLALLARRAEALEQYSAELSAHGSTVRGMSVDVLDADRLAAAFNEIATHLDPPDVLVYNVAAGRGGVPSTLTSAELIHDLRMNVVGALQCAQHVLSHMRTRGSGTILFTGGGLALFPSAQYAALAIGKAALRNLTLCLAEEVEPDGIHVATVTIAGGVQPGTHFDPDRIAETYWLLHTQPRSSWEREIIYR
jgi:short-subunit dehydrogenase